MSAPVMSIDFETASQLDLKKAGVSRYARDSATTVLALAWAIGDELPFFHVWQHFDNRLPAAVQRHIDDGGIVHAWNAAFEMAILEHQFGFAVSPDQFSCTMQRSLHAGYPAGLADANPAIGLKTVKDMAGHRLMLKMCKPRDKALAKLHGFSNPDAWWHLDPVIGMGMLGNLGRYCSQDVEAERAAGKALPYLSPEEKSVSEMDWNANHRGVRLDLDLVRKLITLAEMETHKLNLRCRQLTCDNVTSPGTQTERLRDWLEGHGCPLEDVGKETVSDMLEIGSDIGFSPAVLEVLGIRRRVAKSSTKKLKAMLNCVDADERVRGTLQYYGAGRTGRWCVDAETLIDTPAGPRRIIDLTPGDTVIGGSGQTQKVLAKIYKGVEAMYRLQGPDGAFVEATAAHQVMTESGWRRIGDCFEETPEGRFVLRRGHTPLSAADAHNAGDRRRAWCYRPDGAGGAGDAIVSGGAERPEAAGILAQQDRGQEPVLRDAERSGSRPAQRTHGDVEREEGGLRFRTSEPDGDSFRPADNSGRLGSTSYRRRQDKQRLGQSGAGNAQRSYGSAQTETWTFVRLGERDVWDITVERDASYLAQGLIHHNSGRLIQPQNFPRPDKRIPIPLVTGFTKFTALGTDDALDALRTIWGDPLEVIARCLRGTIIPADNKVLVVFDFSQIEARVLAWLAGQNDILQEFAAGRDVYVYTQNRIGLPTRDAGKVVVLGLGYGTGWKKFIELAKGYGLTVSPQESQQIVQDWRDANQHITGFWRELDDAARNAIQRRTAWGCRKGIVVEVKPGFGGRLLMTIQLPSGRFLYYRNPRLVPNQSGRDEIVFDGIGQISKKWELIRTWGAKLAENITQAVARDIMAAAAIRMENRLSSSELILSVHDELIWEAGPDIDVDAMKRTIEALPAWAQGLPVACEGGVMRRYGKK